MSDQWTVAVAQSGSVVAELQSWYPCRYETKEICIAQKFSSRELTRKIFGPLGGSGGMLHHKILKREYLRMSAIAFKEYVLIS